MASEPMEEDDSFNDPIPRSIPSVIRTKTPAKKEKTGEKGAESDVESDDSFETFEPTQTTGGGSIKSSSSSTQSNDCKAPPPSLPPPSTQPFRPTVIPQATPSNNQYSNRFGNGTGGIQNQPTSSKLYPPLLQRSSCQTIPMSQMTTKTTTNGLSNGPKGGGIGVHSAVTNTKNGEIGMGMTQKPTASSVTSSSSSTSIPSSSNSQTAAPASPNSLARHRSANSGLRNSPFHHTPGFRPGNMFGPRTTPPLFDTQTSRPVTPSGDVIMLRDQLENEKRKMLKLQSDYQKDTQKKEEDHLRNLSAKDAIIDRQKKDIEMLKATMACRKEATTTVPVCPAPPFSTVPTIPTTVPNPTIKKILPKIPSESRSSSKTPKRPGTIGGGGHISVFRHPFKEEMDDTFEMNSSSFEPSATSTPKMTGLVRTGIRRPLDLGEFDGPNENARGAPTPKRKAVFKEERKRRTRKELNDEIRRIQMKIDPDSEVFQAGNSKNSENVQKDSEDSEDDWLDKNLTRKFKILQFRKKNATKKPEKLMNRAKNRIIKGAELRKEIPRTCENCQMDSKIDEFPAKKTEKEWEKAEKRRMELARKGAEELRTLHYTSLAQSINRKGIDELTGAKEKNRQAEEQFQKRISEIKMRSLEEIREEKRQEWRQKIMENLEENGELMANLEIKETGRNEDFIWTEDEEIDYDLEFPQPYHFPKCSLCRDCNIHQSQQRRMSKKEKEKIEIISKCLQDYGIDKREQLRNMSILTKSRIEAAESSLFRENFVADGDLEFMKRAHDVEMDDGSF